MGRMQEIQLGVDPVLSEICRGYHNPSYVGTEIFPIVNVKTETGKIPTFGKESFQSYETLRALRAPSNEMSAGGIKWDNYQMEEYDLSSPLDYREVKEPNDILDIESTAAQNTQNALELDLELRCARIAQDPTTYIEEHRIVRTTGTYFNDPTVDFLDEIISYKELMRSSIALYPNLMVIPHLVWKQLRFHPKLKSYITTIPGIDVMANLTDLAKLLEFDKIVIGDAMYTKDNQTFSPIWVNNITMAYVAPPTPLGRNPHDPSFAYTLRKSGYPYADKYDEEGGKIHKVRSTDMYAIKVVGKESGLIISNPIDPNKFGK